MSLADLITPLIWIALVAFTIRPPFRRAPLGFAVFVLTMAINELPMLFVLVVLANVVSGFAHRPAGLTGAAWWLLYGSAVAGLVWIQARARRTRPALAAALDSQLGADWRSSIRPDLAPVARHGIPWAAGILLPFQRHSRSVERIRNVSYGPDPAHRLDLYRGRAPVAARPVLIHLHGGGFTRGRKSRESVALLNQLAAHGWLCISADYRLRADGRFPNSLIDTKRVIAWSRAHAETIGGSSETVLAGCSAGAHLAVSAALTAGDPAYQPGFEDADTAVSAAVSLYGYLGPRTEDPASAPTKLAGRHTPALLLIQGRNDTALPPGQPRVWAASLHAASASPLVYAELPGAQHSFDLFASVRARVTADAIDDFLAWVRSRTDEARAGDGHPR